MMGTVWQVVQFTGMMLSWRSFPDNSGHKYDPGCFRCHSGRHKDTQGNMVELSQMITHPGMRKAESMEVLNLTLHQVRHTFRFLFCLAFLTRLCVLFP